MALKQTELAQAIQEVNGKRDCYANACKYVANYTHFSGSRDEVELMRVAKIYSPNVTAIKLENEEVEPRYFTCIPGEPIYLSEDVILNELD